MVPSKEWRLRNDRLQFASGLGLIGRYRPVAVAGQDRVVVHAVSFERCCCGYRPRARSREAHVVWVVLVANVQSLPITQEACLPMQMRLLTGQFDGC
jgi:hypothetical protein